MDRRKEQKPQRPYLTLHCDLCGKDYKENAWHRHGPFRCVPGKSALSVTGSIVKDRVGLRAEWCFHCRRTVVVAGVMASGGGTLICERCANAGMAGRAGHDLPSYAIEWADATRERLDATICAREWRAWEKEAEAAERSGQPEVAALAQQRSAWMLDAYKAFMAVRDEL